MLFVSASPLAKAPDTYEQSRARRKPHVRCGWYTLYCAIRCALGEEKITRAKRAKELDERIAHCIQRKVRTKLRELCVSMLHGVAKRCSGESGC